MAEPSTSSAQLHLNPSLSPPALTSSSPPILVPRDSTEHPFQAPPPDSIQLPLALPLSHEVFRDKDFDPDRFLLSRRHILLDDLKTELRGYLGTLRAQLVSVINEDYEDFIGLGIGLRGNVERAMGKMKAPVEQAKIDVQSARVELEDERDRYQNLLSERRRVLDGKKLVELMLKCGHAVSQLEVMLSIQPTRADPSLSNPALSPTRHRSESKQLNKTLKFALQSSCIADLGGIENSTKRTERITNEYNQMLYLVSKGSDLSYVLGLRPRIDLVTQTLHRELASLLKLTLHTPTSDPRKRACLSECLRAYESLSAIEQAEELIKQEIVLPAISKIIKPNSLNPGSISPQSDRSESTNHPNSSRPLLTPSASDARFTPLPLPDDPELVPLPLLYNKILTFIACELTLILDVTDRQSAISRPALSLSNNDQSSSSAISKPTKSSSFNVLINAVISPILQSIAHTLGSNLFAAGNPVSFHRNYNCTIRFLDRLEGFCSAPRQVLNLRADPNWKAFKAKWQLAVYAQIRTREMIVCIEEGLSQGTQRSEIDRSTNPSKLKSSDPRYQMRATETLDQVVCSLWQDDVFLVDLTHRFWRLTLMAISRYSNWLENLMAPLISPNGPSDGQIQARTSADLHRVGINRASHTRSNSPTPGTITKNGQVEEINEEEQLRECTMVAVDILRLQDRMIELFDMLIGPKLPKVTIGVDSLKPEAILRISLDRLENLVPRLIEQLKKIIVRRCSEKLRFIRTVGSTARASKKMPKEASYFIKEILSDLKHYITRYESQMMMIDDHEDRRIRLKEEIVNKIIEEIIERFNLILLNVKKSEDSLKKLKKGRQGFSIFNNNLIGTNNTNNNKNDKLISISSSNQDLREDQSLINGGSNGVVVDSTNRDESLDDEHKVKVQIKLDIGQLEIEAKSLGFDVDQSKAFKQLRSSFD